jgi:hypothetical protein
MALGHFPKEIVLAVTPSSSEDEILPLDHSVTGPLGHSATRPLDYSIKF